MSELSEKEELESLAKLIEELQRMVNTLVRRKGLTGHEFHPLNVLDSSLFNVMIIAKLAAGSFAKSEEPK